MGDRAILAKLERMRRGKAARVLDLFAGCGGISLGLAAAGFEIAGAVERDPIAALSHAINFHPGSIDLHAKSRDIQKTSAEELIDELALGSSRDAIDVIVGGPPCQAFAVVGRPKLREIAAHPSAFRRDPRARLYVEYLEYVRKLKPLAVFMENVPEIMRFGGRNIPDEICESLNELGYVAGYTLLNAAHYGVPQTRERLFLLAWRKELRTPIRFPQPDHYLALPQGYEWTRATALNKLRDGSLFERFFKDIPTVDPSLPPAVTAEKAIGDLPVIKAHLDGTMRGGPKRFTEKVKYPSGIQLSPFARAMRRWPGFAAKDGVFDHVIRWLPRDYPIFKRMKPGDQYPEALWIAIDLCNRGVIHSIPPYDATKFPNKWRKIDRHKPVRTLMAHLGKDGYSHIHYDSHQARTISVREAARLQSFPDGFIFAGTMNPAFTQIGNAVPPLLARKFGELLRSVLTKGARDLEAHTQPLRRAAG